MESLKVGSVKAVFRDIELDFGLLVGSFEVTVDRAAVTLDPFAFDMALPGKAVAVVTERAIGQLLAAQAPPQVKDFEVSISGGKIYVTAKAQVIVTIPVKAVCFLEIVGGHSVYVRLESVDVMGGAAKNLVESQIEKVNPVLTVSDLPVPVELQSVECESGRVTLHGVVKSFAG